MKITALVLPFLLFYAFSSCENGPEDVVRDDFKPFYNQYKVDGSFVIYDQNNGVFIFYNQSNYHKKYTPASTFKICNSLIGIETGVIEDENHIIHWDSIVRSNKEWNRDHTLKTAIKYSTVWYYQELARQVGSERMKYWLEQANYGNANINGGIDLFWLTGDLRITPAQQIEFLRKLYHNELPFSERTIEIVKKILIIKETEDYTLSAKTGWGQYEDLDIGWYVGYLETKDNVYYFANCIENTDLNNQDFAKARIDIVLSIFSELGIAEIDL